MFDVKTSTSQNIQNYAKLRKWSTYTELHRFDMKNVQFLNRWTPKVSIASIWRQNEMSYVAKHSKLRTKVIKF